MFLLICLLPGELLRTMLPGGTVPGGQLHGTHGLLADFQPGEQNGREPEDQVSGELAVLGSVLWLLALTASPAGAGKKGLEPAAEGSSGHLRKQK